MRAGDLLGERYRLVGELGRGGFGVVWEAYDQRVGRQVAVKTLRHQTGPDAATDRARFGREMAVLARLVHQNVVLIFDQGEVAEAGESYRYLVMELLNGLTLKQALATSRPELSRALDWGRQLCAALAAAHAADVIHRDIKPENIMFTGPEQQLLKVLDFGIAQIGDNKEGSLTSAGVVIGSAPYLAPERWRGEPGTVRSDLYALGCVLFELFTGARPFSSGGTYALMVQHVEEVPVRPTALPRDLAQLLLELLAKDPADRPAGAAEVGRRLDRAAEAVRDLRRQADAAFQAAGEGRPAEGLKRLRPLIEQFALAFGPGDGRTVRGCHDFAVLLARLGAHDQAYCLLDELLPHATAALGEGHPDVEDIQHRLARTPAPDRPCPPGLLEALLTGVNRTGD
ncbi:serine/threonine-protein kinase [Kitasatospora sp. NBC_01266]|uniref:serine/threonine-protein kinase n=1 Tax=Kitasatospora sp. NBC_01266 TaxID=2903572 RepID=UPI002E33A8A2|nr:serine/threonine-protein kinase [Kitasatospora sp. NBC_01266]